MATRAKKSRGKSGGTTSNTRGKPAVRSGGSKSASKKSSTKKASAKRPATKSAAAKKSAPTRSLGRPAMKKASAKRPTVNKAAAKKAPAVKKAAPKKAAPRKTGGGSPLARVTRVAKEVAQQASAVVTEGMESIKEMGENLVERVTG